MDEAAAEAAVPTVRFRTGPFRERHETLRNGFLFL